MNAPDALSAVSVVVVAYFAKAGEQFRQLKDSSFAKSQNSEALIPAVVSSVSRSLRVHLLNCLCINATSTGCSAAGPSAGVLRTGSQGQINVDDQISPTALDADAIIAAAERAARAIPPLWSLEHFCIEFTRIRHE
ncbi:hypothetical protein [Nitrobacter hamburgensis]|nr:hypothetical protein [Nitrobacter hamburgensis]